MPRNISLQRDVAVLLRRVLVPLAAQQLERLEYVLHRPDQKLVDLAQIHQRREEYSYQHQMHRWQINPSHKKKLFLLFHMRPGNRHQKLKQKFRPAEFLTFKSV